MSLHKPHVLFVCLGNICRSPLAQGVFRAKAVAAGLDVETDSAGTGGWHVGDPPDSRALAAAAQRGYDIADLRARQVTAADFQNFDLVLAMDQRNLRDLQALRPDTPRARLNLFLKHAGISARKDVPDPYYDGSFDTVLDLIEAGCDGVISHLQQKRQD